MVKLEVRNEPFETNKWRDDHPRLACILSLKDVIFGILWERSAEISKLDQVHLADQTLQWNPWEFTGTDVPGTPLAEEYALHHLELVFIDS